MPQAGLLRASQISGGGLGDAVDHIGLVVMTRPDTLSQVMETGIAEPTTRTEGDAGRLDLGAVCARLVSARPGLSREFDAVSALSGGRGGGSATSSGLCRCPVGPDRLDGRGVGEFVGGRADVHGGEGKGRQGPLSLGSKARAIP